MAEFYALGCALTWSLAVVLFRKTGENLHPVALNFYKNLIGFLLIVPTVRLLEGVWYLPIEPFDLAILALSGTFGIGIADALFLVGLKKIGASRIAIIDCLYSPFIITLSVLFLGEDVGPLHIVGTMLVITAVILATRGKDNFLISKTELLTGSLYGCFAILLMAGGILMVKPLFSRVALLWIVELRLLAGLIVSFIVLSRFNNWREHQRSILTSEHKFSVFVASVLATYVSMIMWVAGFKFNQASVAAVLNQTATIFTVIFAVLFLKERLTWIKLFATIAATTGVILMSL